MKLCAFKGRVILIQKILFLQILHGVKLFHLVSDFQNFDLGTPSAIFSTPQNAINGSFWVFLAILGYQKWHFECPNKNSKTTFQYKYPP